VAKKKATISELVCFLILAVLIYPLFAICKSFGFSVHRSEAFVAAFAVVFVSSFFFVYYWLERRRLRKRLENWEREFEKLSPEGKAERFEEKDTPFDRYIQERIKHGDLTREQWQEMESEAHSLDYSPEITRQNSERMRKTVNRLVSTVALLLLFLIAFYVFRGMFS